MTTTRVVAPTAPRRNRIAGPGEEAPDQLPDGAPGAGVSRAANAAREASLLYLHNAHRLGTHCERPDHLADMRREAEREIVAQGEALAAVIRTVLACLDLPEETERRGLEILVRELRRLAAGELT